MKQFDFLHSIEEIILRDLDALHAELVLTEEANLWKVHPGVLNATGTLTYHLCGNLRHFIGATLANDGYVRQREEEFSKTDLTKEELLEEITSTKTAVAAAFSGLTNADLDREMPDTPPQHKGRSIGFFLMQLSCHLSRHTGQLNYARRIH